MFEPRRWPREAWIPIVAGLLWLWHAASFGIVGFLFSLIPGCLLLSSGISSLLYPGDLRIPQFTALGGVLGVPLAVPAFFSAGAWPALALLLFSAASFVAAGALSVAQEPHTDEVPAPRRSVGLAAQVAIDDAILASMALRLPAVLGSEHERVLREVHEARQLFGDRGWLEDPADYHESPPPLTDPRISNAKTYRLAYEHLRFESAYEPRGEEPGRDRWLSRVANRTAHAWVLRHRSGPRPWLICIHGYEMGSPNLDLLAFRAARLHFKYGLNVALPVLPLHGPRRLWAQRRRVPRRGVPRHGSCGGAGDVGHPSSALLDPQSEPAPSRGVRAFPGRIQHRTARVARVRPRVCDCGNSRGGLLPSHLAARRPTADPLRGTYGSRAR